jgi:hypothetical protein
MSFSALPATLAIPAEMPSSTLSLEILLTLSVVFSKVSINNNFLSI